MLGDPTGPDAVPQRLNCFLEGELNLDEVVSWMRMQVNLKTVVLRNINESAHAQGLLSGRGRGCNRGGDEEWRHGAETRASLKWFRALPLLPMELCLLPTSADSVAVADVWEVMSVSWGAVDSESHTCLRLLLSSGPLP